jgi:hypothetical protein
MRDCRFAVEMQKTKRQSHFCPCLCSGILGISPTFLTYNSDTILASKRIFNPFMGIWVIMPDSINPETVFIPSWW